MKGVLRGLIACSHETLTPFNPTKPWIRFLNVQKYELLNTKVISNNDLTTSSVAAYMHTLITCGEALQTTVSQTSNTPLQRFWKRALLYTISGLKVQARTLRLHFVTLSRDLDGTMPRTLAARRPYNGSTQTVMRSCLIYVRTRTHSHNPIGVILQKVGCCQIDLIIKIYGYAKKLF